MAGNDDDDEVSLTNSLDRHARYLGIDPVEDSGYMWIAREALDVELPPEWIEVEEEEGEFAGHVYYYNTSTGNRRLGLDMKRRRIRDGK